MTTKNRAPKALSPTPSTPLFTRRQALPAVALTATALVVTGCADSHEVTYDSGISFDAGLYDVGTYDMGVSDVGVLDAGISPSDVGADDNGGTFDGGIAPSVDASSE